MVKIIVDAAADCSREDGNFDVCIPLTVSVDGKEYAQLEADRFYQLLVGAGDFPKTSQPSPETFVKVFEKLRQEGDTAVCLTLSSALSGTYQSAVIASAMVDYEGIYIVDTLGVTHMIGLLASFARQQAALGATAEEIARQCEELKTRVKVLAGLDTLEYLYKGGRLSRASATVGQIAGIKPIITLTPEGRVSAGSKAIGVPRAIQTIVTKLKNTELDPRFPIYTLYSMGTENTQLLEEKLSAAGFVSGGRRQVGPVIGAHTGPGVYGVLYVSK